MFPALFGEMVYLSAIEATYSSANFAPFVYPTGQTSPVVAIIINNTSDEPLIASFDGVTDNLYIPATTVPFVLDLATNLRGETRSGVWLRTVQNSGTAYISCMM